MGGIFPDVGFGDLELHRQMAQVEEEPERDAASCGAEEDGEVRGNSRGRREDTNGRRDSAEEGERANAMDRRRMEKKEEDEDEDEEVHEDRPRQRALRTTPARRSVHRVSTNAIERAAQTDAMMNGARAIVHAGVTSEERDERVRASVLGRGATLSFVNWLIVLFSLSLLGLLTGKAMNLE
jgi:hypothetical protein